MTGLRVHQLHVQVQVKAQQVIKYKQKQQNSVLFLRMGLSFITQVILIAFAVICSHTTCKSTNIFIISNRIQHQFEEMYTRNTNIKDSNSFTAS